MKEVKLTEENIAFIMLAIENVELSIKGKKSIFGIAKQVSEIEIALQTKNKTVS